MKAQINTPESIARFMVTKLFFKNKPTQDHIILDPGCGQGAFIKAILEWCKVNDYECPRIIGIESDGRLLRTLRQLEFIRQNRKQIRLFERDFLLEDMGHYSSGFDFIICNPPYVRLEHLSTEERKTYRKKFETAVNRFDLYLLFFEQALKVLKPSGRLVFLTPERFEYSVTAQALRKLMTTYHIEEIHHINEDVFKGISTSPAITVISNTRNTKEDFTSFHTNVTYRDTLEQQLVTLPCDGSSWLPSINSSHQKISTRSAENYEYTLADACRRISCGIETGLDEAFIIDSSVVLEHLKPYAFPFLGGRDLTHKGITTSKKIIIPYSEDGPLLVLSTKELQPLLSWLSKYKERLVKRTCVTRRGKQWYSFHEEPRLQEILQPKILCKDITKEPQFWMDKTGDIVPGHSVYYIILKNSERLNEFARYLNSPFAKEWLRHNCPRAIHGYIRMQSKILKKLPVPLELARSTEKTR
jgi:adenine-specific DNA-methyltransferase